MRKRCEVLKRGGSPAPGASSTSWRGSRDGLEGSKGGSPAPGASSTSRVSSCVRSRLPPHGT
eukprot:9468617-Pyramimonas_sp.AAC.1